MKTLDVYKPIGDTAEAILREQGKQDYDKYDDQRLTSSNMSDDYVFSDPLYVAIKFFDIMVSESTDPANGVAHVVVLLRLYHALDLREL